MSLILADVVYALCVLTSAGCATLLLRAYGRTKVRLLFWSGICFVGLALNNVLLIVDLRVFPEIDLFLIRTIPAALGVSALIYGLIQETR